MSLFFSSLSLLWPCSLAVLRTGRERNKKLPKMLVNSFWHVIFLHMYCIHSTIFDHHKVVRSLGINCHTNYWYKCHMIIDRTFGITLPHSRLRLIWAKKKSSKLGTWLLRSTRFRTKRNKQGLGKEKSWKLLEGWTYMVALPGKLGTNVIKLVVQWFLSFHLERFQLRILFYTYSMLSFSRK